MPESSLSLSYPDFMTETSYFLGYGRDVSALNDDRRGLVDSLVQSGVRQVYYPPVLPGDGRAHQWSFLEPVKTFSALPEATGALLAIPNKQGHEYVVESTTATFKSDHVGLRIEFDTSGNQFEITEFISAQRVKAIGIDDVKLGEAPKGTVAGVSETDGTTLAVTADASVFTSDMVGDIAKVTISLATHRLGIKRFISATQVDVQGSAAGASGSFTIERNGVSSSLSLSGTTTTITASSPLFRSDMAGDTIRFIATDNTYTIATYVSSTQITVASDITGTESATDNIRVEISATLDAGNLPAAEDYRRVLLLESTDDVFESGHVGQKFVSADPDRPATATAGLIRDFIDSRTVKIQTESDIAVGRDFFVARMSGVVSSFTPLTTGEIQANLPAAQVSAEPLTQKHVGLTMLFLDSGLRLRISKIVSSGVATYLSVGGTSPTAGPYAILGPTDQAAGDTFTVRGTGMVYDLPDDFGAIDGDLTFGRSEFFKSIPIVGEGQIRSLQQRNVSAGNPRFAAIRPLNNDGRSGQRFELLLWPSPDATYNLTYRYKVLAQKLSDTKPYALGGMAMGEVVMASCLAQAENHVNDERGVRQQKFLERLSAQVSADREAITPQFFGYNADGSDDANKPLSRSDLRDGFTSTVVTLNGVTPK